MGDVVISIILQERGLVPPDLGRSTADLLVTAFDETHLPASLTLAAELRSQGIKVASYVRADKLAKQFKYADRNGIKIVLVLGPDELAHDLVTVKDLSSGEQQNVPRTQLTERLRQLLS